MHIREKNANLSIDAQNATDNTPLSGAKIKQNEEKTGLYNLGYSPLSTIMIENCLEDYPDFKTKQELIGGLKFDFKLEYTVLEFRLHALIQRVFCRTEKQ